MSTKEKYWKYSLVTLILGLGALILGELWAFVSGLLGAFTIFVLVRKQMIVLTERWHWPRFLATVVVLVEVEELLYIFGKLYMECFSEMKINMGFEF